ncbi:MAG: PLP-dependent transferase [Ruminococcus sp.]|nr:PLP-dependent transferase [Ruminococcus sp.]
MSAPINDFVKDYIRRDCARFHMPGHKGVKLHGMEEADITEIKGADYLFDAVGIIGESEEQTARAFGAKRTLYSTEGSSLCIKAMLGIIARCRNDKSVKMLCAAPRNVHKAFINACILLDIEVRWIYPDAESCSICSSGITPSDIERTLSECERKPDCVYITSPDYPGNMCDIKGISTVCRREGVPLLCDNAHGAYLRFLEQSLHPITLGADMCCDSAHKTLPCYTGGAYLHISPSAPEKFSRCAKDVMSLFASTSPSYLILQSLDLCSDYICGNYPKELADTVKRTALCKKRLEECGWTLCGDEPCKITVCANTIGYEGGELAERLRAFGIEPEYSDFKYIVLMTSPFNREEDYLRLESAARNIPQPRIRVCPEELPVPRARVRMGIRQAAFSDNETVSVDNALGRICASTATCCQPSVPVVVSGEEITADVIKILKRYSICQINVL